MFDDNKKLITHQRLDFLTNIGYSFEENEYGIDYKNGNITVFVFWGRYYDSVDIVIQYENSDNCNDFNYSNNIQRNGRADKKRKHIISISNRLAIKNPLLVLFIKDDIKRFNIIADYFINNCNGLLGIDDSGPL